VTGVGILAALSAAAIAFAVYPPAGYAAVLIVMVLVAFAGDTGG
jgi:hypothetical protein